MQLVAVTEHYRHDGSQLSQMDPLSKNPWLQPQLVPDILFKEATQDRQSVALVQVAHG